MDRDYDTGRLTYEEFYGDMISAEEAKNNLSLDENESSIELDSFLGTFQVV